jgi:lipid-A-disaccharide synthase
MRYYIIAGEKSGDIYGGRLTQALQKVDPEAVVRGLGGKCMQQAGAELLADYHELAVMGLRVLASFKKLYGYFRACQQDILHFKPHAIILIDYAGFNLRIAQFAKKKGFKVFYYVPPKVWAWQAHRINTIKASVDHVFAIFPFEKAFYARYGYEQVSYLGHPLVDEVTSYFLQPSSLTLLKALKQPLIALLPGSRVQEVEKIFPHMVTLARGMPTYQFVVAALSELPAALYKLAEGVENITMVYDQTHALLSQARVAVITAGTASLEALFFNIPQVVVYKTDCGTYNLAKYCLKIPYLSLVNILAEEAAVEELIQHALTAPRLQAAVEGLLLGEHERGRQLAAYEQVRSQLGKGGVAERVAQGIRQRL